MAYVRLNNAAHDVNGGWFQRYNITVKAGENLRTGLATDASIYHPIGKEGWVGVLPYFRDGASNNTGPNTPQDYKNNILAMLEMADPNGIRVLPGSLTPTNHFIQQPALKPAPRIKELNEWLHNVAAKRHAHYVDYFSALVGDEDSMLAAYSNGALHPPNTNGYKVMKAVLLPIMKLCCDLGCI